jgi:hypothetical protein
VKGDSTEQEDSFPNTGMELDALMEGLTPHKTQENICRRHANPEPSNLYGLHGQKMIGNKALRNEAETSGTRESQYYFFRPRNDISYLYWLRETQTEDKYRTGMKGIVK